MPSSSGSTNLLELLTELRASLLTRFLFYYKRVSIRSNSVEEIHRARCVERGTDLPWPSSGTPLSITSSCSSNQKLLELSYFGVYRGFNIKAWLIKLLSTGNWTQSLAQLPSPEVDERLGSESSNPLITELVSLVTSPRPRMLSQSYLINIRHLK